MTRQKAVAVVGALLAALAVFAAGFSTGRLSASPDQAPRRVAPQQPSARPSEPQPPAPSRPVPEATSSPSATAPEVSPAPDPLAAEARGESGDNVLAAAGNGSRTLRFAPTATRWRLSADYRCQAGTFEIEVRRSEGLVLTLTGTDGAGTVEGTVPSEGEHVILVSGDCTWAVRASG